MNALLLLLFVINTTQPSWVSKIDEDISQIEKLLVLKKSKSMDIESGKCYNNTFRVKDWKMIEFHLSSKDSSIFTMLNDEYYFKKKQLLRVSTLNIFPHFYKGGRQPTDPIGYIEGQKFYFENENEGIKYTRKIDFLSINDIDSLLIVLNQQAFTETPINNEDYLNSIARMKRSAKLNSLKSKLSYRKYKRKMYISRRKIEDQ